MNSAGRGRRGAVGLALASLTVILLTTLRANPAQLDRVAETTWSCLVCGDAGGTDVLLNLLLFAPLGVALRWLGWSGRHSMAAMFLLTLGIEGTQALLLAGRDASASDVLANSLGGILGWWGAAYLTRWLHPSASDARRGATMLLLLATLTWMASGWGLHSNASSDTPWVGQPLHRWRGHDPFPGSVQQISLNGVDVPNDPLPAPVELADSVALMIRLTRHDASTPLRPVSLLRIVDANSQLQMSVTQRDEALLVSVRARASRWRVRTPTWRFDDAMAVPAGAPWQLAWRWLPDRVELLSGPVEGDTAPTRIIPLSVGLGWAFVHPFAAAIGSPITTWWTVLWLALWGLPLGWFLGWLPRGETVLGSALAIGAYLAASLATGLPIRGWEVLTLAASVAVGIFTAKLVRPAPH